MGDRCIIYVKGAPAAVYLHWDGNRALELLRGAIPRMRLCDECFSSARLVGHIHTEISGNLSLGLIDPPKDFSAAGMREYSHGDAGVIVYDCSTGTIVTYAGYTDEKDWQALKPPAN
jgi:hypothetical protein